MTVDDPRAPVRQHSLPIPLQSAEPRGHQLVFKKTKYKHKSIERLMIPKHSHIVKKVLAKDRNENLFNFK